MSKINLETRNAAFAQFILNRKARKTTFEAVAVEEAQDAARQVFRSIVAALSAPALAALPAISFAQVALIEGKATPKTYSPIRFSVNGWSSKGSKGTRCAIQLDSAALDDRAYMTYLLLLAACIWVGVYEVKDHKNGKPVNGVCAMRAAKPRSFNKKMAKLLKRLKIKSTKVDNGTRVGGEYGTLPTSQGSKALADRFSYPDAKIAKVAGARDSGSTTHKAFRDLVLANMKTIAKRDASPWFDATCPNGLPKKFHSSELDPKTAMFSSFCACCDSTFKLAENDKGKRIAIPVPVEIAAAA